MRIAIILAIVLPLIYSRIPNSTKSKHSSANSSRNRDVANAGGAVGSKLSRFYDMMKASRHARVVIQQQESTIRLYNDDDNESIDEAVSKQSVGYQVNCPNPTTLNVVTYALNTFGDHAPSIVTYVTQQLTRQLGGLWMVAAVLEYYPPMYAWNVTVPLHTLCVYETNRWFVIAVRAYG